MGIDIQRRVGGIADRVGVVVSRSVGRSVAYVFNDLFNWAWPMQVQERATLAASAFGADQLADREAEVDHLDPREICEGCPHWQHAGVCAACGCEPPTYSSVAQPPVGGGRPVPSTPRGGAGQPIDRPTSELIYKLAALIHNLQLHGPMPAERFTATVCPIITDSYDRAAQFAAIGD